MDVREAYEFAVLNVFLINEEELDKLLREIENEGEDDEEGHFQSNEGGFMRLELDQQPDSHEPRYDNFSDDSNPNLLLRKAQEKKSITQPHLRSRQIRNSLMNSDLERLANEA